MEQKAGCREGQPFLVGVCFLGRVYFFVIHSDDSISTITPPQAQGRHQIDHVWTLTPSHPGVHSSNFNFPPVFP